VKVWAASRSPSPTVRYGAQVSAISSTVMPCLIAYTAARMASPALGETRLTPRTRPVARWATILTRPRVSRLTRALGHVVEG
jgi:hypothetical protein